jgi:hypothetical protein
VEVVGSGDDIEAGLLRLDRVLDEELGLIGLVAAQPCELHPSEPT